MADKKRYPKSNLPIRRSVDLLPVVFQTPSNDKFLSGVLDPLIQPGVLDKVTGYIGRRYGKTYKAQDVYVDTDDTLRSRYQLEPAVITRSHGVIENFYDYIDLKNQLAFFGNSNARDDQTMAQTHYTWNPPIDWDKFVNYREYYWQPSGPAAVRVTGQNSAVTSTYKVVLGTTRNSFVFTPDSYTNNPTLTLFRGQTYKFRINAPGEGLAIRTGYDTGSLLFQPSRAYFAGSLVVYDGKLWRAVRDVSSLDTSSITIDSQDWQYVEPAAQGTALEYKQGITNNGIANGVLTFQVPFDAPDTLYYQGLITPDAFGRFVIADIESNAFVNVDTDINGKINYTSGNGVQFTNGMTVEFSGNVLPAKYAKDTWLVEGVGTAITLTRFRDLIAPVLTGDVPEIVFDNEGFDTLPFDDATEYATYKDYITIARHSADQNSWSRYNRWFHRSVLEAAYRARGIDFPAQESARAKRPIIEFKANLQLFNHGSLAKQSVDYLETVTTDVFSQIEGATGYSIDGEFLFEGARVLVTADSDSLANNRIYSVSFITHNNRRQLHLTPTVDSESIVGQCVLVRRGTAANGSASANKGQMFHCVSAVNGVTWRRSQAKTAVNQAPFFDAFDNNQISFSDAATYADTTFVGTHILSYQPGQARVDSELGFALSYENLNNVGDIKFDFRWDIDEFAYLEALTPRSKKINMGYLKFAVDGTYDNCWTQLDTEFIQPVIDSQTVATVGNTVTFAAIDWLSAVDPNIIFYVNGNRYQGTWTRRDAVFTFPTAFNINDVIVIKVIAASVPDQGYYAFPAGLESNPFNLQLKSFTLGQTLDHINSALEWDPAHVGSVPGVSNLRDLSEYTSRMTRFLKHSGIAPLSTMLLCDKTHNIVKAIDYSKQSYTDFKNNFIAKATELEYNDSIIDFVDDIINALTTVKKGSDAFAESNMLGAGAYTVLAYTVNDTGILTFSLSSSFDLNTVSAGAVYVYRNGSQLLNQLDYEFDAVFGFVRLLTAVALGDTIEIREYLSTATNHIPPTPTAMGLYKKYTPSKFVDDTYVVPRLVIQGHDGSITAAYKDFRDDLLLELEYRIYNNIRRQYNSALFDIDSAFGGYYESGQFDKAQLDQIVIEDFLQWNKSSSTAYTVNDYFDSENPFTYTYSNMSDPTKAKNIPGYWRGVYRHFYDTDRPHRCPWEMLGFSQQPAWWQAEYGSAPYTSNNLILWEDLENGVIRQGPTAGRHVRYQRPGLSTHIPVDGNGLLLSPLDSNLAQDYSLINNRGPFVLGDVSPVEHAWRASSEWPFAVIKALCVLKPLEYMASSLDTAKIIKNRVGQYVHADTDLFVTLTDILPSVNDPLSLGLIKYLRSHCRSMGMSVTSLQDKIAKLDVALSARMSGFVDQQQQKFLLDSKSPVATAPSVYIPPENYDIIFHVSTPVTSVVYSGVRLEKSQGGWIVQGYDDSAPRFNYFQAQASAKDPIISVGGVSENFTDWIEDKRYNNGALVRYQSNFYRALKSHTSAGDFDRSQWKKLTDVPKIGAIEARLRRVFNTIAVRQLSYGTLLTSVQQVVDFLLGYEAYLKTQGVIFDKYDAINGASQDWLSSAREYMFWTKHNWEIGAIIALSPSAQRLQVSVPVGVADNLLDEFYKYQVIKGDGTALEPRFLNFNRTFQNITIDTVNTTDGIYFVRLHFVIKEHVAVFSDRTVFNDVIYDKSTGYRQGRIKMQAFRTVDWDGDYTSPGFLFDNVNIQTWQPFQDYRLGDIVRYKSYNWTSVANQLGQQTFANQNWTKLDSTPTKQLVANFDYKINQFSDYFETATDGVDQSQRSLARHSVGYQQRDYLQNLATDPVTQFQLYQGFIREKGTANSVSKIFDKLSRSGQDSIQLNEEWAFLVGQIGGTDQIVELEMQLEKNKYFLNPQLLVVNSVENNISDAVVYKLAASDFTVAPVPFASDFIPMTVSGSDGHKYSNPTQTAGYVSANQYQHVIRTPADLTTLNIDTIDENDHIWVTFYQDSWQVLRVNETPLLYVTQVLRVDDTTVTVTVNRPHTVTVNEYIGIREVINLVGFFLVTSVTNNTLNITVLADSADPEIDGSTTANLQLLTPARTKSYADIDQRTAALLKNKSLVFVDNQGNDVWQVIEKNKTYSAATVLDFGTSAALSAGSKVIYDNNLKHVLVSVPGSGLVNVYVETAAGLQLKQIIAPPIGFYDTAVGSFGNSMAVSPDSRYLIISAPLASGVANRFMGEWQTEVAYEQDDVVLYGARLYRALNANGNFVGLGDGSTLTAVNSDDWVLHTTVIAAAVSARNPGYFHQGMVAVYEFVDGRYVNTTAFVSPRPTDNEKFGSELSIGVDSGEYYLAVSAIGAYAATGRVYLIKGIDGVWSHMENPMYKGIYNTFDSYKQGEIVWQAAQDPQLEGVRGNLWAALADSTSNGDGSTLTVDNASWLKVSEISTHCSLPANISVEDDGSTLEFAYTGLLTDTQKLELVKQGDQFGFSMAMSSNGQILVIGAPDSDGEFFARYRGLWRPDVEYVEGEVVRHRGSPADAYQYYQLGDANLGPDSTYRSVNEDPSNSVNWQQTGDSTTSASGKIFVYKKTAFDSYELTQMINATSLSSFTDMDSGLVISTGDQFGYAVDMDSNGKVLTVSSPRSDINYQDQGAVYVLTLDTAVTEFRVQQRLQSYEIYANEYFGFAVSVSPDGAKIAVGARNTRTPFGINFDILQSTTFDNARTRFFIEQGYTGGVYVFDAQDTVFFLTEKLDAALQADESFGHSVDCVGDKILVGSPYFVNSVTNSYQGTARLFTAAANKQSWNTVAQQQPIVDLRKIKKIELYDNVNSVKIQDIDYINAAHGKILNLAEQELSYKTPYDPAAYTLGTDQVVVDASINWLERNVGKLWWNTATAKFIDAEQGDAAYRQGNWNQLVLGASIDVYEWVETVLLPNEWAALADTNQGLAQGISGQPLYPNNDVLSVRQFFNSTTGAVSETLYYYWVKNHALVPPNMASRTRSAAEVAALISAPAASGVAFMALVGADKFITYNFQSALQSDTALLNMQFRVDLDPLNAVHNEYQLLTDGVSDSLPSQQLENKWIDSLIGSDLAGNRVPAVNLSVKQRYGIKSRPRQTMFENRVLALRIVVEYVNSILAKEMFADTIDLTTLNSSDQQPVKELNLYDVAVDTVEDRDTVGTVRTKRAVLRGNIINGELDTIDIVDAGFGYKPEELFDQELTGVYLGPPVSVSGDGTGASAVCHIDGQGRVIQAVVTARGKKYSVINLQTRYFSVLVKNDATLQNYWSIYAWDDVRKTYFRSVSQTFDTTKYWTRVDWTAAGYDANARISREFVNIFEENGTDIQLGVYIRIKEYASGGWAIFENIAATGATFLDRYKLIAREQGTIEISTSIYDTQSVGVGFDNTQPFDSVIYDIENARELRNILTAVKQDIFLGEYAVEWNRLFFVSMRYVLSEQQYVDWIFKTSFVNVTHNVGALTQKTNYRNDNLQSYQEYIAEVKPYRTTIREYVSRYDSVETYAASAADFDLPATYNAADGAVQPVTASSSLTQQYPWKWWTDHNGYSVTSITVFAGGSDYTYAPTVLIQGNGAGATAVAYISNGRVTGVKMLSTGNGYTQTATVTLVGGNPTTSAQAKAVAQLGDTKVRTFDLAVKFDRISKTGYYQTFVQTETFTGTGNTAVFALNYAPTNDKSKITVSKFTGSTRKTTVLLSSEYDVSLFYQNTGSVSTLRGRLKLMQAPLAANGSVLADVITVTYDKNIELFDAVNRIEKNYQPTQGMAGKELGQLMTGIDFGGVQIQGTTFDVTGGWDALPWFTDNWDSVEASADYYHVCDGSTGTVTLPYVPAAGQLINIYIKRKNTNITVRIDDENFVAEQDSSTTANPRAEMPTFVGNGISAVVEIGSYLQTNDEDVLIFRPIESDGAVIITDDNIVDTQLSGGSLSAIGGAYVTANGVTAEQIAISGGKFVEPDHVPAPEENVPGQVLESVSIKVYQAATTDAAALQCTVTVADGVETEFAIGQTVLENKSVFVYVNNISKTLITDYTVDLINNVIVFGIAPSILHTVEILSIGVGGVGILDYQNYTADGETNLFLTNANYDYTSSVFVTVNGVKVDTGFKNSTDVVDAVGRTLIEFGIRPAAGDVVRIVCLQASADVDSSGLAVVQANRETLYFDGSTRTLAVQGLVYLSRQSADSSVLVEVNGILLRGVDTEYAVYDGTNNVFVLGEDPLESGGAVLPANLSVYINGSLANFITDYRFEAPLKKLTVSASRLVIGDQIKIVNDLRAEYAIVDNNLIIDASVNMGYNGDSTSSKIDVNWFNEYPSLDMITDQSTGGKVQYGLSRAPISDSYVWVYVNGERLRKQTDFYVSLPRGVVYLNTATTTADLVSIITFSSDVYRLPLAYEIHKDMLNVYRYTRYSENLTALAQSLSYYDTEIHVNTAAELAAPVSARNLPGTVLINGERIEYMLKVNNVLSQLRRGAQGTAIAELHAAGQAVVDVSYANVIPYNETQQRTDFVSDGSTLLIGPLDFVPLLSVRTAAWIRIDIPSTHGACDEVEVFASGRRLLKDSQSVWQQDNGAYSPEADTVQQAEFSVDGITPYIRLSAALPAGTRTSVLRKQGKTWYDRGATTATSGQTFAENQTAIAKFIVEKSTTTPE